MKKSTKVIAICVVVLGIALVLGQVAYAQASGPAMMLKRITRYLDLTPTQQAQARVIFKAAFLQAKGVLTPAQIAQVKAMRQTRKDLHLTAAQRAQMKPIRAQAKASAQAIRANAALSAADQATQLQALRQATRLQFAKILTPAQLQQLQDAHGHGIGGALRALNLTEAQQTQLKSIRDTTLAQFRAILTPAQQAKVDQFLAEHPEIMNR